MVINWNIGSTSISVGIGNFFFTLPKFAIPLRFNLYNFKNSLQ